MENAKKRKTEVIYSNTRAKLGLAYTGNSRVRVSVISIINLAGFEEQMEEIM